MGSYVYSTCIVIFRVFIQFPLMVPPCKGGWEKEELAINKQKKKKKKKRKVMKEQRTDIFTERGELVIKKHSYDQ